MIKEIATQNRLWGAERLRGELLKLGLRVSKRTIQKYMRQVRTTRPRGQNWATFLRTHAKEIWACDFLPVTDLLFHSLFAFFIIELHSRKVIHVGVTRHPTDAWTAQQLREATAFGQGPNISSGITIANLERASLGLPTRVESRFSQPHITPRGRMPSVNAFWGVCGANVLITCSSCMRSSFNGYSTRMSSTSTMPGRIKGSGSRFQIRKLGQYQQITQVARSSPSPSWVDYITTIAGALEFIHPDEKVHD